MNKIHMHFALFTVCLAWSVSASAPLTKYAQGESSKVETINGQTFAFPDVCKTPSPAGPVPIPYPNAAMSSNKTATNKVKVDGQPVETKNSNFKTSVGDEPGSQQGVVSSKIKGEAEFVNFSMDVKIEGKVRILQFDIMTSNKNAPSGQQVAPSQVTVPAATSNGAGSSVTEVSYIDASGRSFRLRESTLIALNNGEYCAVCMTRGRVTAIHRLISATPKRKVRRTDNQ